MVHATVNIKPILGETLDSRDEAIKLFESLRDYCSQCGELVLDFSDILFMSRSFADQFHKEKMKWHEESNVSILILNESEQMLDILKAVSKTQGIRSTKNPDIKVHSFSKRDQLFNYLNTL